MKRFLFFSLILLQATFAIGQQVHFVYLQTENRQPFYVRLNEKLYSSSASGYLIIPKLQNGEYNLALGFPKNEWPVQNITVKVNNRDLGFSFKNFEEKGWGLFNFQNMEVLMAAAGTQPQKPQTETSTDLFSSTLANVVNTPSIKEKPRTEPENAEEKPKELPAEKKQPENVSPTVVDTVAELSKAKPDAEKIQAVAVPGEPLQELPAAEKISRINNYTDADGDTYIYIIEYGGIKDTVRLFMPAGKVLPTPARAAVDTVPAQRPPEEKKQLPEGKKAGDNFLTMELPNPNAAQARQETPPVAAVNGKLTFNSDCKAQATNDDFLKVRRKMAAASGDADMIAEARKLFKQKCFSTEQVKNLSALFLADEGKYQFFEAAYPFIFDTHNFSSLASQLSGEAYIGRFKTLVRQ
ncbi:MAG: DUF4476 domain-containing protein [Ferruginibacter sp.]